MLYNVDCSLVLTNEQLEFIRQEIQDGAFRMKGEDNRLANVVLNAIGEHLGYPDRLCVCEGQEDFTDDAEDLHRPMCIECGRSR